MTPDQCAVVREHLAGWWLAAALCGGSAAQRAVRESYYGTTRMWRYSGDGTPRWTLLTRQGIRAGVAGDRDGTLVATWQEISGHVGTLPAGLAQRVRDAYAGYSALVRARNVAYHARYNQAPNLTWLRSGMARLVLADAEAAEREYERDTLTPLLDQALTYRPPAIASQPDIFDLLAEAA